MRATCGALQADRCVVTLRHEEEISMPSLSTADQRARPPRIEIPRDYNAAHDLIERNLVAGPRGQDRVHRRRRHVHLRRAQRARQPLRERTHGARHLARAARAALPPRHHRLPRRVPRCDQGGHRADRGEHAAHDERLRLHAARQPRPRADRLGGAAAGVCAPAGQAPAPCARDRVRRRRRSGGGPPPFAGQPDGGGAERRSRRRRRPATTPASGCIRRDRPARRRAPCTCIRA